MISIQVINRLMLLVCAPFIGMIIVLFATSPQVKIPELSATMPDQLSIRVETDTIVNKLTLAGSNAAATKSTVEKVYQLYEKTNAEVAGMIKLATAQLPKPNLVFESRISTALGTPVRTVSSGNIDLKLYKYQDRNYKGYALKADLKTDKAMKMVIGKDKLGGSETTLSAASRYAAIAGINAGGFADAGGSRYPTDNTIYNGKYIYGFFPPGLGFTFIGLSTDRKLIGGSFARESDLEKLKPSFGVSFQPILMQRGQKSIIPDKWYTPYRAPRTVIGNFKNDQLLVIVTDGYDEQGGSGATLGELQDKMKSLGIVDAYNLDGGGSSTLVFDGALVNNPSDGKMRSLPTHFLFFK